MAFCQDEGKLSGMQRLASRTDERPKILLVFSEHYSPEESEGQLLFYDCDTHFHYLCFRVAVQPINLRSTALRGFAPLLHQIGLAYSCPIRQCHAGLCESARLCDDRIERWL
jgi:hypothetical protein